MYSLGKDDLELLVLLSPLTVLGLQVCVPMPGVYSAGGPIRDLTHVKEALYQLQSVPAPKVNLSLTQI